MAEKKKAQTLVSIHGNEATQVFDYSKFKTAYDGWKNDCGISGEALHIKSSKSLLDLVSAHGDVQVARPYTDDPVDDGAGNVIELLDKIMEMEDAITTQDVLDLRKIHKKLVDMADTKSDPRNIVFTVPIFRRVNRENADFDEESDTKEIYGHYRTEDYVKYRNLKAKLFNNVNPETIKAVPKDWYSESKNTSEPPMWQALYAGGGKTIQKSVMIKKSKLVSKGLLYILKDALKALDGVVLEHLKLKIVDSGKGTTAGELMQIPDVKDWIEEAVGKPNAEGWGINKTTGMFRDTHVTNRLKTFAFTNDNVRESKTVKRVADYDDIIGHVKGFTLIITRRQVRNLAILTGKCKKTPGKDTVYMPGVLKKAEIKKSNSWRSVLAW